MCSGITTCYAGPQRVSLLSQQQLQISYRRFQTIRQPMPTSTISEIGTTNKPSLLSCPTSSFVCVPDNAIITAPQTRCSSTTASQCFPINCPRPRSAATTHDRPRNGHMLNLATQLVILDLCSILRTWVVIHLAPTIATHRDCETHHEMGCFLASRMLLCHHVPSCCRTKMCISATKEDNGRFSIMFRFLVGDAPALRSQSTTAPVNDITLDHSHLTRMLLLKSMATRARTGSLHPTLPLSAGLLYSGWHRGGLKQFWGALTPPFRSAIG